MIIDVSKWLNLTLEQQLQLRKRVFLDGVEQSQVWFADTEGGYIRTYNVFGDHRIYRADQLRAEGRMESDWDEVNCNASKTLMGKVTFKDYEER